MSKTYSEILTDAQNNISDNILKGEGSLVYNVLSAAAFEEEALYQQAEYILAQLDPETADYEYLVILAKQRGITPEEATPCKVKIVADAALPIGSRFSLSVFNYAVTEIIEETTFTYAAVCETAGSDANGLMGELIPISYVPNLNKAEITEILIPGSDADDRDTLYKRYKASFNNQSFAGNAASYQKYMNEYEGIGGCKVHPTWNGAGTVKCVVIGSDHKPVSEYLISQLTAAAYRDVVPIGVDCTIVSAVAINIDIALGITYASGYSWDTCNEGIKKVLEAYMAEIREGWEDTGSDGHLVIYLSRVQAALLDVEGVMDITSTTLNGQNSSLGIGTDEVPLLGTVSEVV